MSPEIFRTISPKTVPQASEQPGDNVSPPTPRTHLNYSFKSEDNLTEGVSFLTNVYKQFATKPIQDCINDGFPSSFPRCQNPLATESSINADVSTSEPGRSYLQATDGWVPFLYLHHMESTQLYKSEPYVIMPQMMNLTRMAIPHCIFNVTQWATSTMSQ